MPAAELGVTVTGGQLAVQVSGEGPPVLVLHGGPGLGFSYMQDVVEELTPAYRVASYQQRGLAPSMTTGPFTVETHVSDLVAVLDALGWPTAYVVGHSWGGYLMLAAIAQFGDRFIAGLGVDSIGVIGDGGMFEFEHAIEARTPEHLKHRAAELDRLTMASQGTEADSLEAFRLVWPTYFADPERAPPMPDFQMSVRAYSDTIESMEMGRTTLAAMLPEVLVPIVLSYGVSSPIPASASTDLSAVMPNTESVGIEGAGHYLWMERPGIVRETLDRLVAAVSG